MVFFFYSISSGRALCPQGRSPPSRGVVGREGAIYALKMVKISRSPPLSPPPPWKEPEKKVVTLHHFDELCDFCLPEWLWHYLCKCFVSILMLFLGFSKGSWGILQSWMGTMPFLELRLGGCRHLVDHMDFAHRSFRWVPEGQGEGRCRGRKGEERKKLDQERKIVQNT